MRNCFTKSAEKTLSFCFVHSLKCPMDETGLAGSIVVLNPDVSDWGLGGDAVIYHKARIFSFGDMLPVKRFISTVLHYIALL